MLVEVISVDQLVDRLRKGKYRSSNDVRAKSKCKRSSFRVVDQTAVAVYSMASEDDDIVAGPQKMSLKCPVRAHRCPLVIESDSEGNRS